MKEHQSSGGAASQKGRPAESVSSTRENKGFTLFRKVQEAMRHSPDFVQTCKAVLDAVIEEIDAENCSIMLQDPVSGELSIRAAKGKDEAKSAYYPVPDPGAKRFRPGEGVAGSVLKEGKSIIINDVKEDPRFVRVNGLDSKVASLICYPIREKDQVVGVFNLSHSKKGAFDEGSKLALSYISSQVGAALNSARFYLKLREMNRLFQDPEAPSSEGKAHPPAAAPASTFVEVGEMMARENGIFIYASAKMHRIKEMLDQVANTDVTVLIQGESGVGKEVVARSLHLNSNRRDKPFVKVNCAALPQELLESELFGYEKGAFTGAYRQKPGKFELANGGTIFLDEIAEISPALQAKLLQVLQDREFSRLGGKRDIQVDVRILAATNKNIAEAVKEGRFREDLFYRLNVVNVTIPALRARPEEIPVFIDYFLNKFGEKYAKKVKPIPDPLLKTLLSYTWPGNIRELENVMQRYVVLGSERIIEELVPIIKEELQPRKAEVYSSLPGEPISLKEVHRDAVRKAEAEIIAKVLELTNWNRKKAAHLLRISYKGLLSKIKECGIKKPPGANSSWGLDNPE